MNEAYGLAEAATAIDVRRLFQLYTITLTVVILLARTDSILFGNVLFSLSIYVEHIVTV